MQAQEATRLINSTVFKPGWTFHASPGYGDGEVYVSLTIKTVDTSYPDRDGTCRKQITTGDERVMYVSHLDQEGLWYNLLKFAAEADEHENREFLKVRRSDGSWYAPLHPHTPEGQMAWHQQRWNNGS